MVSSSEMWLVSLWDIQLVGVSVMCRDQRFGGHLVIGHVVVWLVSQTFGWLVDQTCGWLVG